MTAKECITGRRSIRKFTDQPVSHELLAEIVSCASYAPSWKNTHFSRFEDIPFFRNWNTIVNNFEYKKV